MTLIDNKNQTLQEGLKNAFTSKVRILVCLEMVF